jgi:hypothetical protein
MRATELMKEPQRRSLGASLRKEPVRGYERRLMKWGCSKCAFFEKRVFRSGLPSEELDAYVICRFAGELLDLIGEATVCPKTCRPELQETETKAGRGMLNCRYAARKATPATGDPSKGSSARRPARLRTRPVGSAAPKSHQAATLVE